MNLKDYLSEKTKTKPGAMEWMKFCTLEVTTGSLWAGDPFVANADDGCVVKVPRGRYVVEGTGGAEGRDRFVSRLRVRLASAKDAKPGKEVGETGTDSCMIGVCDIKALDAAIAGQDGDAVQEEIESQAEEDIGIIRLGKRPGVTMPFVPTGSDGSGPVIALRSGGKCVGIQLSFLGEEEEEDEAGEESGVSLIGKDTPTFKTWRLADGGEASFWVGGVIKAGARVSIWSSAEKGPVDYRILAENGKALKQWTPMKKKRGGGAAFGVAEVFKAGRYQIDFRIGEQVFSGIRMTVNG